MIKGRVEEEGDGDGTGIELVDTRKIRSGRKPVCAAGGASGWMHAARSKRVRAADRIRELARSQHRRARLSGIEGFAPGDRVEDSVLSPDRTHLPDLYYAQVMCEHDGQMGVPSSTASDIVGRHAGHSAGPQNEQLWGKSLGRDASPIRVRRPLRDTASPAAPRPMRRVLALGWLDPVLPP